ncbi:MAG TPA: NapC/NirT family cytochrome c [Nitrospirota bacterium]
MKEKRWPRLAYNSTSMTGAFLASVIGFTILFLLAVDLVSSNVTPYVGVLLYLVLPFFLLLALLLIPLGMYLKKRALAKGEEPAPGRLPSIDLNNPQQRNAAAVFVFGSLFLILLSAVGVYKAYQFTDSVAFCGLVCHRVMAPEYTAYHNSPHAHVKCVDCHIGPGAGWYARSKLSGLYQVYATVADKYPRPLPTPIKDLRPVQVECHQCHWPEKFYGTQQKELAHYRYDKDNTYWPINMLVKTGGGDPGNATAAGIHWHMSTGFKVEYIPRDKRNQDIPWIRITDRRTGRSDVYQDASTPLSREEMIRSELRVMDCIDCHNRPSHNFHSPDHEIDQAIYSGKIDPSIPEVKMLAVRAMSAKYRSDADARAGIAKMFKDYYRSGYPEIYSRNEAGIEAAVKETAAAYERNVFPEMKAMWSGYPDNIGHFIFPGCMRCHDGNHKDAGGNVIRNDCHSCHVIISQGSGGKPGILDLGTGLGFIHPVDIGDAWKGGACFNCHAGVQPM